MIEHQAIEEIQRQSGRQFDSRVVEALLQEVNREHFLMAWIFCLWFAETIDETWERYDQTHAK